MVHDISYVKKSWMMKKPLEQNELASSRSGKNHKSSFYAIQFLQQMSMENTFFWKGMYGKQA